MAEYLAEKTVNCIQEFKYEKDTLAFVGDNTSVDPKMVAESIPRLPVDTHSGEDTYVGCAGHQIDLSTRVCVSFRWRAKTDLLIGYYVANPQQEACK